LKQDTYFFGGGEGKGKWKKTHSINELSSKFILLLLLQNWKEKSQISTLFFSFFLSFPKLNKTQSKIVFQSSKLGTNNKLVAYCVAITNHTVSINFQIKKPHTKDSFFVAKKGRIGYVCRTQSSTSSSQPRKDNAL